MKKHFLSQIISQIHSIFIFRHFRHMFRQIHHAGLLYSIENISFMFNNFNNGKIN
jgi:hypothetical protein